MNQTAIAPLEQGVDHIRGSSTGPVLLEYGDYECPYSRAAYRQVQRVERRLGEDVRFAFRHFPLTDIHPHALAASLAAEAASLQGQFWAMHDALFHGQQHLEEQDLRRYAAEIGLDVDRFDHDRATPAVRARVARDVHSGLSSGQVHGTPTLFVDGLLHRGEYNPERLIEALAA